MSTHQSYNLTLVTGATEVALLAANARLIKIIPMGATTGTVTAREASAIGSGSAARWVNPAATTNDFGSYGVKFAGGLTIQLSVAGDTWGIVWGPML